jgi:hypothetical protein
MSVLKGKLVRRQKDMKGRYMTDSYLVKVLSAEEP